LKFDEIDFISLEKHETKDIADGHQNGVLTVIWRDWDKIIEKDPKMIYTSLVHPNETKGPHLHHLRTSYFVCISGKVVFVIKDKKGNFHEIESSEENPTLIQIPKGIPAAHINISNHDSIVLTIADVAWRPNDNEMENVSFDNYDWFKWEIKG